MAADSLSCINDQILYRLITCDNDSLFFHGESNEAAREEELKGMVESSSSSFHETAVYPSSYEGAKE